MRRLPFEGAIFDNGQGRNGSVAMNKSFARYAVSAAIMRAAAFISRQRALRRATASES